MKRNICILLVTIMCVAAFSPITALAATYELSGTDITVSVDDTSWYVFTRDNITNNPEMEELGISYDTMYNIFYDNNVYMDAVVYDEDGEYVELFVRKTAMDSFVANLSNYDNEEVLKFADALAKEKGIQTYSVYESQYKFAELEYYDDNFRYYICEYVTIVNKDCYVLTFQSTLPYTDWMRNEIKSIVDSVRFDVDTTLKEEKEEQSTSIWDGVAVKAVGGAVIGGITGGVIGLINKKKKNGN